MGNSILKLIFDAPLQSYGIRSKWAYRETDLYPTKSSVIGLLGSAIGIDRTSKDLDELNNSLKVHIRVDKQGYLDVDLQTVNNIVYEAESGREKRIKGKLTHPLLNKVYLSDAIFTIYVEGEVTLIDKCYKAIKNPKFPLFIGRKCCMVTHNLCLNTPYYNINDIKAFIENDEISCYKRVLSSFDKNSLSGNQFYFDYYLEDFNGNILKYDNMSSSGQKFYRARRISKNQYARKVKFENNEFIFE